MDLVYKLLRSEELELRYLIGVDPMSRGLKLGAELGLETSFGGVDWMFSQSNLPDIVFEATSARVHAANAPFYAKKGIRAIDLTPASIGPYVIPTVNLTQHINAMNVNMVTCGGQATIPIIAAVSRVVPVEYAEIVASLASKSAGPGTRANIDEFTETTSRAIEGIGGAKKGKAIIILNPAEPPLIMRDTIYCSLPDDADEKLIIESIEQMVADVSEHVPGYHLLSAPQFNDNRVTIFVEIEGRGDFLPKYSGNLDIMTASATRVGNEIAKHIVKAVA